MKRCDLESQSNILLPILYICFFTQRFSESVLPTFFYTIYTRMASVHYGLTFYFMFFSLQISNFIVKETFAYKEYLNIFI